jgi:hypothetical protein
MTSRRILRFGMHYLGWVALLFVIGCINRALNGPNIDRGMIMASFAFGIGVAAETSKRPGERKPLT